MTEPDDILERATKADRGDIMTARTVVISARPVIEAPLRALLEVAA